MSLAHTCTQQSYNIIRPPFFIWLNLLSVCSPPITHVFGSFFPISLYFILFMLPFVSLSPLCLFPLLSTDVSLTAARKFPTHTCAGDPEPRRKFCFCRQEKEQYVGVCTCVNIYDHLWGLYLVQSFSLYACLNSMAVFFVCWPSVAEYLHSSHNTCSLKTSPLQRYS